MDEALSTRNFRIEPVPFDRGAISVWSSAEDKHRNWPIVYTINGDSEIYIGETTSAAKRLNQHLDDPRRKNLTHVRIVLDDRYNKSACLDLESHLIRFFAADGRYTVTNLNHGITDADYFDRATYRERFDEVYQALIDQGMLTRSIPDIVNSDMFKFSPFKAINTDQAVAVEGILETLSSQMEKGDEYSMVVQGDPGTGKTIVAIYLAKLLVDIGNANLDDDRDSDSMFIDFFQSGFQQLFAGMRIGIVIPQQSLRKTIAKVFARTPGLQKSMILSQFEVGSNDDTYDLLIVDEAHRLGQRANQASAAQNTKFTNINVKLFGSDDVTKTQLDWIRAKSTHQFLLIDSAQSVKPGDLPLSITKRLCEVADRHAALFRLSSQMRVEGGNDYIEHIGDILNGRATFPRNFGNYEFRLFDDIGEMNDAIRRRNSEVGLARMVAGYAWNWASRKPGKSLVPDIVIDGHEMFWNRQQVDWVNSPTSIDEVGSIHTVQGYDLNYAGVIIGRDLQFDTATQKIVFSRSNYFDKKGMENNPRLGIAYSDEEILEFVKNIYRVLLTRGIKGTYIHVCDPALREHLRQFIA